MKSLKTYLILIALSISTSLGVCQLAPPNGSINDSANILTESEEGELNSLINTIETSVSTDIVIATITSLEGKNIDSYAIELGDSWGIGKENKNGIVILLSSGDRKISIRTGNNIKDIVTNGNCQTIVGKMTPYFKQGEYYNGFRSGLDIVPGFFAKTAPLVTTPGQVGQAAENNISPYGLLWILLFLLGIAAVFIVVKVIMHNINDYESHVKGIENKLNKIGALISLIVSKQKKFKALRDNIDAKFPIESIIKDFEFVKEEYENILEELSDSFEIESKKGFIHYITHQNLDNIKVQCDDLYKSLEETDKIISKPLSIIEEYNQTKDKATKLCFSIEKNIEKLRKEEGITEKQLEKLHKIQEKLHLVNQSNDMVKNYDAISKMNKDVNEIDVTIQDWNKKKKESIRLAGEISKKIEKIKGKKKLSSKKLDKLSAAEQKLVAVNQSIDSGGTDWLQYYLIYSALNNDCKSLDAPAPSYSPSYSHSDSGYSGGGGSSYDYGSSSSSSDWGGSSGSYDSGGSSFDSGGGGGGDW